MGRYKGLGMPRAKKKKLDAAHDRLLKQADSADAENTAPQVDLEPAAAPPAAGEPTAADKLKQELLAARRKARVAGWIAGELQKDVQSAKRDQQLKLKVVDAKMSQWLREARRSVKSKRPNAYVQLQRCSKIEQILNVSQVVAARAEVGSAGCRNVRARCPHPSAPGPCACAQKIRPLSIRCSG